VKILQENESLKTALDEYKFQNYSMTAAIKSLMQETEHQKSLTSELHIKLAQSANAVRKTEVRILV
jgi:hypothetical protein